VGKGIFSSGVNSHVVKPISHLHIGWTGVRTWVMWDLWWAKWLWDMFFSEFFHFVLSISLHRGSAYTHITLGMNSSQTWSNPIDVNNINK
jgi:hypothetical protein